MTDNNSLEKAIANRAKESLSFHYVEFLKHIEAVKSALLKGYGAKTIWQALTDEGLITFKYSTFYKYLKKEQLSLPNQRRGQAIYENKRLASEVIKPVSNSQSGETHQSAKSIKLNLPDGMSHNPMINPKDLI